MSQNATFGGWTDWTFAPDAESKKIFEQTLGNLKGVKYRLVASATQVVSGMNYAFLCEARTITAEPLAYIVVANVYVSTTGETNTTIKRQQPLPTNMPGGWQNWNFAVTGSAEEAFNQAVGNRSSLTTYFAKADASQVVSGVNYCFLCEVQTTTNPISISAAMVYVNQPAGSTAHWVETSYIDQTGREGQFTDLIK